MIALEANQKYYTTSELKNMGYSYYKIGQMEENGQLHRINRTKYGNDRPGKAQTTPLVMTQQI